MDIVEIDAKAQTVSMTKSMYKSREGTEPLPAAAADSKITDTSDSSVGSGKTEKPFINSAECTSTHDGRQLINTILPVNIDTLFKTLYSNSKFLDEFYESRKVIDMTNSEWKPNDDGRDSRTFKCKMPIKQNIGPKYATVTEVMVLRNSIPGCLYSVDIVSWNEGVPYGDVFEVNKHHCLVRTVDDHTMFSVYVEIKFKKYVFSMIKSLIEKATSSGCDELHADLLNHLQNTFRTPLAKGKRPKRGAAITQKELQYGTQNVTFSQSPTISLSSKPPVSSISSPEPIEKEANKASTFTIWVIIILLIGITLLNAVLFIKLTTLQSEETWESSYFAITDSSSSKSREEWIEMFESQEIRYQKKLTQIKDMLVTSINMLKETEKTMSDLLLVLKLKEQT